MAFSGFAPFVLFLGRIKIVVVIDSLRRVANLPGPQPFKNHAGFPLDGLPGRESKSLIQFFKRDAIIPGIEIGLVSGDRDAAQGSPDDFGNLVDLVVLAV